MVSLLSYSNCFRLLQVFGFLKITSQFYTLCSELLIVIIECDANNEMLIRKRPTTSIVVFASHKKHLTWDILNAETIKVRKIANNSLFQAQAEKR